MNGIRLYWRFLAVSVRAQMQFPGSFLMVLISQALATSAEFVGIWALFRHFGQIKGWTFPEVAVFYAVINMSFSITEVTARGFDIFGPQFVKTGNFDRLLLRPRSAPLQLLGHECRLTRLDRFLQGAVVLVVAAHFVHLDLSIATITLLLATVAGGVALFAGIMILQATLSFWTIESLEIANTLTYGGVEASQYPLDIYARWFRQLLIFVVPLACVGYFPVVRILGHHESLGVPGWLSSVSPLMGFLFLAVALRVWRIGVRHYRSTGS
jgi:ABC-2 type transport system permease protein